jgi:hypothetical protein
MLRKLLVSGCIAIGVLALLWLLQKSGLQQPLLDWLSKSALPRN